MRYINNNSIEALQLCAMDKTARHAWIFSNIFMTCARDYETYSHASYGDVTREYIASGLYDKFLKFRDKLLNGTKRRAPVYDRECTALDIDASNWTLNYFRKSLNTMNFATGGEYKEISAIDLPSAEISVKGAPVWDGSKLVDAVTIPAVHTSARVELERAPVTATKRVDIIDLLKREENRDARTESRKVRQFVTKTDADGYDEIQYVKSNYGTPETILLHKCAIIRARQLLTKIYNDVSSGARIIDIVSSGRVMTGAERKAIHNFRMRHSDLYEMFDYLSERVELEQLETAEQ